MAWTIGPAGGRAERRRMLLVHCSGLALGALTAAAVFTLLGSVVRIGLPATQGVVGWLGAALLIGWGLRTVELPGLPFPRSRWQVPEEWRTGMPYQFTMSAYGYLLGLGFLTDVVVPAYWLLVLITMVDGGAAAIGFGWLTYLVVRCAVTVRASQRVAACPRDPTAASLAQTWERPLSRVATAGMLAVSAEALLVAAG
jgi:hypothetical protein